VARSPLKVLRAADEAEARNDPEFRQHALAHSAAIVDSCARLYLAAQEAGELRLDADVPALARHTLVCFNGALQV
jgi:hypothetical protein